MMTWKMSVVLTLLSGALLAQPGIEWSKNVSENRSAIPNLLITGPGNSYYAAGRFGADAWAIRVDQQFNKLWEYIDLGGSGLDAFQGGSNQVIMTSDQGVLMAGSSYSSDGDLPGNYGDLDAWLMKMDRNGNKKWSRNYGTSGYDNCTGIVDAENGEFYALFNSYGKDRDFPNLYGISDIWVARLDFQGNILWKKQFGGSQREYAFGWVKLPNGNLTIVARSESIDGDLTGTDGTPALWLLQIDPNGNKVWSKTYAGIIDQFDIQSTLDGGFIVCGKAFQPSAYLGNKGKDDGFIKRFDANGNLMWARNYGGSEGESLTRIKTLSDGNFIAVGKSFSNDGDLPGHYGKGDCWVMKVNGTGQVLWSRNIGGTNGDSGVNVMEQQPGQYYLHMYNGSFDGDFTGTTIRPGSTIVKLNENLNSTTSFNTIDVTVTPTLVPQGDNIQLEFPDNMPYSFELFNISGQLQLTKDVLGPADTIPTSRLEPGMYIYLIRRGEYRNSGKIIVH